MCAGNVAAACGKANFPQEALEEFTKFGLECIQQQDAKYELRETAISYFSEISKILRSEIAPILPQIIPPILKACASNDGIIKAT